MSGSKQLQQLFHLSVKRQFFTYNNHRLSYIKTGHGPSLLLLHGANIGLIQWYANFKQLSERYTVYALDLPGCGNSTKISYRDSNLETDFREVLSHFLTTVIHSPSIKIVSHSFSGWLSLQLAKTHKEISHLVLINPLGFSSHIPLKYWGVCVPPVGMLLAKTVMRPTPKIMKGFLQSVCYQRIEFPQEFIHLYTQSLDRQNHPFFFMQRLIQPFRFRDEILLKAPLDAQAKTTFFIGAHDPFLRPKAYSTIHSLFPQASFELFQQSAHLPFIEEEKLFQSKLKDALS